MTTFPVDWYKWRSLWNGWLANQQLQRSSYMFPGNNFLADEVLGVYSVNDRPVELSEVVFTLGPTSTRYVGVTFGKGSGNETAIAGSFEELEEVLGL